MGTCRIALAFLVLSALACAQQSQPGQFKLEGVVVNSVTGKPVPRALIQVSAQAQLTGPEGDFAFDGLSAGAVRVQVTKPGYFAPGDKGRGWSRGSSFAVGPDTGRIVLKISPEAVITGRITGKDDEPLEGASVEALTYMSMNDGPQQLMPARGAVRSDEDGNFRLAGLPAGRYYITVRAGGVTRNVLGAQTSKASEAYATAVYYPGTEDLSAAGMIELAPGQHIEAPFSLSLRPAYKVSGTVVTAGEWKQVNPPNIVDAAGQPLLAAEMFDAKTGTFEFRTVTAGTYTVRLSGTDAADRHQSSNHKIAVTNVMANLRLVLHPGADIPVVVRTEFAKPPLRGSCTVSLADGSRRSDCSDYPAAHVELMAVDSAQSRFSTDFGPTKDGSAIAVHGVAPGRYLVRARAILGGYVQSVRSGTQDLFREELTVPEEGNVMPIEVVLRDDWATLKVTVHPEAPGQQAQVVLFQDGALLPAPNLTRSTGDEVSYVQIPGGSKPKAVTDTLSFTLAPGTYKVFAFDSTEGVDYGNPAVLAKYSSKATSVTVSPNDHNSIAVDMIHTGD